MGYDAAAAAKRLIFIGGSVTLVAAGLLVGTAGATPNLRAIICRDTPASVTIARPQSDSVINASSVTLSGDVTQSSQLEIYIDDAFNGVESLSSNTTKYSTTVQLSPGTHAIKVVAIDMCQVENASASVVLTYQPVSLPSEGGQVATNVDGTAGTAKRTSVPQDSVVDHFIVLPLISAGQSLNLVTPDAPTGENNFTNSVRFLAILTGLALIIFSHPLQALVVAGLDRMRIAAALVGILSGGGRRVVVVIGALIIISVFVF